jgi:hypothetical protein
MISRRPSPKTHSHRLPSIKPHSRSLASFRNQHAGNKIVVCGCGRSLTTFRQHDRVVTIGVNDVGRLFDPDYLVLADRPSDFTEDRMQYVMNSNARYIFTYLPDILKDRNNVIRFRPGKLNGTNFLNPSVLHYTNTSIYMALCLAVQMGGSPIGIIGFDLTRDHFFANTGEHKLVGILNLINMQFSRLNRALKASSISVFNLSHESRITAFTKLSLKRYMLTK